MKRLLLTSLFGAAFFLSALNANAQNTWLQKASLTAYNGREDATGFSIGHYGFIGTGNTSTGLVGDFWKWDQRNNTWTSIANYPGAGEIGNTAFSINGKGYCCLGYSGSANENDLWEYDTTTNTWTQKATFPGNARYGAFVFVLGHKAYVGCGEPDGPPYYQDMWVYDANQNTWTQKANFPGGIRASLAAFALNGYGYAGCGWDHSAVHNDMWKYDTTTNTWTSVASFPISPGVTGPACFVIDTLAFVGTGLNQSSGKMSRDFWYYSSKTNTWTPVATLTGVGRWTGVSFSIGDRGYIGTGYDSVNDYLEDYWEYTPSVFSGVASFAKQTGGISVYPNPSNGQFNLQITNYEVGIKNIEVYNILGEKVYSNPFAIHNSQFTIDLSSQPSGIYLYRVMAEDGNLIGEGKLVIQK
jgi:N-acetylneuraminic acid mutarotase